MKTIMKSLDHSVFKDNYYYMLFSQNCTVQSVQRCNHFEGAAGQYFQPFQIVKVAFKKNQHLKYQLVREEKHKKAKQNLKRRKDSRG